MNFKTCAKCGITKPFDFFYKEKRNKTDGRQGACIECKILNSANYYKKNTDQIKNKVRNYNYIKDYGITIADYDKLFAKQNGFCAICGSDKGWRNYRLAVDHNHETGEVRGLLCDNCNTGLGMFKDNPSLLAKAINYLS